MNPKLEARHLLLADRHIAEGEARIASQEAILKAMLALRDPEENRQRLATGLTIDELAVEVGTDVRVLKLQLNRLADRDIRLLEAETPTGFGDALSAAA